MAIIALILLFGIFLRIPYFFHTMQDIDEGSHAAIAAALMNGGLPYLNGADNKPPGIFYVYKATFCLFGKYNMTAIHVVTFFWTLATAIILSLLAKKLGGKNSALFALLFYLTFTAALYPKMLAANTEIFMALPYSLAALLLWHACAGEKAYLYVLAGFVSGLSPLFKQVGGVAVGAVLLYLLVIVPLWHGRKRILPGIAACAEYGVGFCLPTAIVFVLFHKYGIIKDWIFWNITYPSRYINTGSSNLNFLSQLGIEFVPFILSTIILWVLAFRWIKKFFADRKRQDPLLSSRFPVFVMLWLAVSTAATLIGNRMFGHYFIQILPPLTLMAALCAGTFYVEQRESRTKAWRFAILALTIVPGLVFTGMAISFEAATDTWGEIRPDFRPAAEYIKKHTNPQDRIFVWGWFTPIYVYSERAPSTRFVFTTIHTGYKPGRDSNEQDRADISWLLLPEAWPMLETDLNREPPELIVDTSPGNYHDFGRYPMRDYPILRSFVERNCRLEKSIAGTDIYRCGGGFGHPTDNFPQAGSP
jgi:4-amino-4-deoxy-L-arabinose transferase-like glycosyltransferase